MAALRAVFLASLGLARGSPTAPPKPKPFLRDGMRRAAVGTLCPSDDIVASVPLPSPLPESLQTALNGLGPLLNETVDPTYPASDRPKPQAAMLQVDYRGERLIQIAVGDKDPKERAGPPSDTTIFRIGSTSKIFPVLTAIQLYDRGIVRSLDDPLTDYCPQCRIPNRFSHSPVTLRELASQLSGFPREAPCDMVDCHLSTEEIVRRLQETPGAQWAEYTEPSYSNLAYGFLGNVLAEHVGMTFEAYVVERILTPLGMKDTGFTITNETKSRMAKPYTGTGLTPDYDADIGFVAPAGQMYSTIADLMKLGRYFLGIEGELFNDGLRRELLLPAFVYSDQSFMVGMPFEMSVLRLEGESRAWTVVAKGGNIMGFSAIVAVLPRLNLSLAAVWTGHVDEISIANSAFEQLLPAFVPWIVSARPLPRTPSKPEAYSGHFALGEDMGFTIGQASVAGKGQAMTVLVKQGQLELSFLLDFYDDISARLTTFGEDFPGSCFVEMALAWGNEWFTFNFGADGNVESLEVPGAGYYHLKYPRVPHMHVDTTTVTV